MKRSRKRARPLAIDGDAVEVVFEDIVGFTRAGAMLRDIR